MDRVIKFFYGLFFLLIFVGCASFKTPEPLALKNAKLGPNSRVGVFTFTTDLILNSDGGFVFNTQIPGGRYQSARLAGRYSLPLAPAMGGAYDSTHVNSTLIKHLNAEFPFELVALDDATYKPRSNLGKYSTALTEEHNLDAIIAVQLIPDGLHETKLMKSSIEMKLSIYVYDRAGNYIWKSEMGKPGQRCSGSLGKCWQPYQVFQANLSNQYMTLNRYLELLNATFEEHKNEMNSTLRQVSIDIKADYDNQNSAAYSN